MQAVLMLEDGATFYGQATGAAGETHGEVVFNTSMTGYQEILTDASYCGEIVVMTYPLIGNYGINPDDIERFRPHARGFVMGEICTDPSNWRATGRFGEFLAQHGVVAITGIDTRALTRRLRQRGTMKGAVASGAVDQAALLSRIQAAPDISDEDLVAQVTTDHEYIYHQGNGPHVVMVDFGAKQNILRCLRERGCRVTVVPAEASAAAILAHKPDGVLLSNGPGDPQIMTAAVAATQELLGRTPIFGICLGHQILGLACGGRSYKLKYGHRGANHPVQDTTSGRVYITSQNHGFAIAQESLPANVAVTHINLNDRSVEGLRHLEYPAFSVQYHPEASPGPQENRYLFDQFLTLLRTGRLSPNGQTPGTAA